MELDLIPTIEAAAIVNVSVPTFNRWVEAGRIAEAAKAPGLRGARFFLRSDVEALAVSLAAPAEAAEATA